MYTRDGPERKSGVRSSSPWDSWRNAEAYREYVERYPVYRELNRRLADLAALHSARRVLDLGCGCGATTAACLTQLPPTGEIVGLDAAEAMVEVAQSRIDDPRASFRCAAADQLDPADIGTFDRVVCNAAFWLFPDPGAVLARLRSSLTPGGLLVFNVPADRLANETPPPDPFQLELTAAVVTRTGGTPPAEAIRLPPRQLERSLADHGFQLERVMPYRYCSRQRELIELMRIPAMAARLAPELRIEECLRAVHRAAEQSDPDQEVESWWRYFVARRRPASAGSRPSARGAAAAPDPRPPGRPGFGAAPR